MKWHLMRKNFAMLLAVIMIISALPISSLTAFAWYEPLVENGNFSDELEHWDATGDVEITETKNPHVQLQGTETMAVLRSDTFDASAGTTYTLSFKVKLSDSCIFAAKILQYNGEQQSQAGDLIASLPENIREDKMQTVEYVFTTAADVSSLAVSFQTIDGVAEIDNVSVKKSGKQTYESNGESVELLNGDFSDGAKHWTVADGKVKKVDGYKGKAIRISSKTGIASMAQEGVILQSNAIYELHYYIKTAGTNDIESAVSLEVVENGELRKIVPYSIEGNTVANDWQEVTTQFATGDLDGKAVIRLSTEGMSSTAKVKAAFDEIALSKIDIQPLSGTVSAYALKAVSASAGQSATNLYDMDKMYWPSGEAKKNMTFSWETDAQHGKTYKVEYTGNAKGSYNLWNNISWEIGKTYTISYWVKTSATINSAFRFMPTVRIGGKTDSQDSGCTTMKNTKFAGAQTSWKQYTFEYTPTATDSSTSVLGFAISSMEKGEVIYLADVQVTLPIVEETNLYNMDTLYWPSGEAKKNMTFSWETDAQHGKTYKVEYTGDTKDNYNLWNNISWEIGKTYTISYWVKTSATINSAFRFMPTVRIGGKTDSQDSGCAAMKNTKFAGAQTSWKQYTFEYTPTATDSSTSVLGFVFNNMEKGEVVYLADVKVIPPTEAQEWLSNGSFIDNLTDWDGITASEVVDGTTYGVKTGKALVVKGAKNIYHKAFTKTVEPGTKYSLRFRARNDVLTNEGAIGKVYLTNSDGSRTLASTETSLTATNGIWSDFIVDFVSEVGFENPRLYIVTTDANAEYTFSDFTFDEYRPIVVNGDFSDTSEDFSDDAGWKINWYNAAAAGSTATIDRIDGIGNVLHVHKSKQDTNVTDAYLGLNEELVPGQSYRISYKIWNNGTGIGNVNASAMFQLREQGVTLVVDKGVEALNGIWEEVSVNYIYVPTVDKPLQLYFRFVHRNASTQEFTDYYVADVSIERIESEADTLIMNGDFSMAIGTYPKYWGAVNNSVKIEKQVAVVTQSGNKTAGITTQSAIYTGAAHELKFRLKADENVREHLKLRLTQYTNALRIPAGADTKWLELNLKDTDEWQNVTVTVPVGEGVSNVDFSFLLEGMENGTFSIDDVSLDIDKNSGLNLDFEIGKSTPIGWNSTAGVLTREAGGYNGQGYAAKITNPSRGAVTSSSFELEGGETYELSYWVKAEVAFDSYVFPQIAMKEEDGTTGALGWVYDDKGEYRKQSAIVSFPWTFWTYGTTVNEDNPNGWVQVRTYFRTADTAAFGTLEFQIVGTGTEIWLDHIQIIKKENTEICNMDFENVNAEGQPEGWYLAGARDVNPQLQIDDEIYHSGNHSAYIKADTLVREQQLINSYQIPTATDSSVRIFEFSFWIASRNANYKSVRLDLWYYDANGIKLWSNSVSVTDPNTKGTMKTMNSGTEITEWSQVITRKSIPAEAKYVSLVFTTTQGAGEFWIDDIFFDQVEDDTAIIADHSDFHAVDHYGNVAQWDAVTENMVVVENALTQNRDDEEGTYGVLRAGGNYMRYRTNTMGTGYEYKLAVRYRSDNNVNVQLRFNNYQNEEYTDVRVIETLPASLGWREAEITFIAPSATTCDFMFASSGNSELSISQMILYQTNEPQTSLTWQAKWISYKDDYRWCNEYAHSYYRKTITLDEIPETAPLQITGDDKVALYVNGNQIFSNFEDATDTWANVHVVQLEKYLKKGKNVIAVDVYNQGAYSALIFDGIWTMSDGGVVYCMSDFNTRCYSNGQEFPSDAWTKENYNDSQWWNASQIGSVPMAPWGDVYFDASLYIDNTIEVRVKEGEGVLVNDLMYEFSVDIKTSSKIESIVPMTMVLWKKNSTKSISKLTPTVLTNSDMREWPVNEWVNVKMQVELPDYIEDGYYSLQLSDTYFFISNEDIYDNRFISFKVVNDYKPTELVTKVEMINGKPTFTVNGEMTSSLWYTTPFVGLEESLSTISNSGIETYVSYQTYLGTCGTNSGLWNENGSFDYNAFDENINTIVSASTEANVIVSIGMYAPDWWLEQNPDDVSTSVDIDGNKITYPAASFGSEKWKKEAAEKLKEIIAHMRQQSYYSRVSGIRILGGNTCEFLTYGSQSEVEVPDYSKAALTYFRQWAKEEYGTIENLRKAWNDDTIASFDTIEAPTFRELKADGGYGMLYNPQTQQKLIDFRNLLSEMTADTLLYWAQAAKEATDNKLVVGAYYGYLFSGAYWPATGSDHSVVDRVISSEYLDFFSSPIGYNERQLGESIMAQSVTDSMRAYGKLFVAEEDNRTVLCGQFAGSTWTDRDFAVGNTHTMEETLLQEKRDMVFNFVNGQGEWLFDMQGGWLSDEQIYEFSRDANEEYNFFNYVDTNLLNDIAIYLPDENASYYRTSQGSDGDGVIGNQNSIGTYMYMWHRKQLNKIGAGYDVYALSTLAAGNAPKHKINIFFTPYVLTAEEREAINTYCKNDGQINIFLYMSGLGDEEGYDLANMTDLTGFRFKMNNSRSSGQVTITNNESAITQGLLGDTFGTQISTVKYHLQEIYVEPDDETVVLGKLNDTGNAGFTMKNMGDWTSIYTASPCLSTDVYRNILKMAGTHIYSENKSDIIWTNSAYVGVHSAASGMKKIYLPGNYAVYDVFEEKYISMDTNIIEYYNEVNDTHLFRLRPVNTYSFLTMVKGGHGTISSAGLEQVPIGATRTITLTPDEGYMIKSVLVNGKKIEVPADNTLTFDNMQGNVTVVVRFKRLPVDRVLDEDTIKNTATSTEMPEDEDGKKVSKVTDDYQEIWATVKRYLYVSWWIVACGCGGAGAVVVLIKILRKRGIMK